MADSGTPGSAGEAGWPARQVLPPGGGECHTVRAAHRLCMASVASRPAALAIGLPLLLGLAARWDLAGDSRCPAPHDALLPTMPCSPRCPAPHDALLPTMPCSPRCPAPHDALLPTMPCSPRCPAPHDALLPTMRRFLGRQPSPSGAIIDSQSVKTTERRPRKKGASGVRRGQAGERPQTAYCGGYPGTAVGGGGAPSRPARPGWGQAGH